MPVKGPTDPVTVALGQEIQRIRVARGLTQDELAVLSGLAGTTVSKYEQGYRAPNLETIRRIADALDTAPSRLLMFLDTYPLPPLPPITGEKPAQRRRKWT